MCFMSLSYCLLASLYSVCRHGIKSKFIYITLDLLYTLFPLLCHIVSRPNQHPYHSYILLLLVMNLKDFFSQRCLFLMKLFDSMDDVLESNYDNVAFVIK